MHDVLLIFHFIGLIMGLGTSFAFLFLGIASSKLEKSEARKMAINSFALGRMGHIGLTLLIVSGIFLMNPYWATLFSTPLLMAKLVLVIILAAFIGINTSAAKKAKAGDFERQVKKIAPIGRISLLIGLTIVVLAVLVFH